MAPGASGGAVLEPVQNVAGPTFCAGLHQTRISTHVAVGGVAKQYGVGAAHAVVFQWRQLVPK